MCVCVCACVCVWVNVFVYACLLQEQILSVMDLMAWQLTTQSSTLTLSLEDHVILLQFQRQHVPMDSVFICLIYIQYVLILTA